MALHQKHTIIIPVYNAPSEVAQCFASLEKSLDFTEVELIILDDASLAETKEIVENFCALHQEVKYICHQENQGYLKTVIEGLALSSGDVMTLLNSDTTIPKDFSLRILACFNSKDKIGIASPILAKGIPFSVPLPKNINPANVDDMDIKIKNIKPLYPTIVFPDGACFSISRECYNMVGSFDISYKKGYFEELDYAMRAVECGFDTVFIDNLYVYHRAHASFDKESTKILMQTNGEFFKKKWGEKYTWLHEKYPKNEHKKRIYAYFYSSISYYYATAILKLAKLIPFSTLRRKIRHKFQ